MSGKHQGLRYFQKFLNSKASERNALAKKVLRCVLAVGFVLSPWLGGEAYAAGIERIDNITLPNGLDKTYEWYAAFGIVINLIWLFYQILRFVVLVLGGSKRK